jgi:hypothetical protein
MTLADANAIAILKLLSPFHPSITLQTTSLPLPKGHPPPGLLAKLNLHVASLYSGARSLLKSNGQDIDRPLLDYLKKESGLADIRARKWLGVEAGETPGGSKIGLALAWLEDAAKRLRELQTGGQVGGGKTSGFKEKMKGLKLDSGGREERKERKGRLGVEEADIEAFTKLYKHMNQTVSLFPVPINSLRWKTNIPADLGNRPVGTLPTDPSRIDPPDALTIRSTRTRCQTVYHAPSRVRTRVGRVCHQENLSSCRRRRYEHCRGC